MATYTVILSEEQRKWLMRAIEASAEVVDEDELTRMYRHLQTLPEEFARAQKVHGAPVVNFTI